jgi:hypothetical protein
MMTRKKLTRNNTEGKKQKKEKQKKKQKKNYLELELASHHNLHQLIVLLFVNVLKKERSKQNDSNLCFDVFFFLDCCN